MDEAAGDRVPHRVGHYTTDILPSEGTSAPLPHCMLERPFVPHHVIAEQCPAVSLRN